MECFVGTFALENTSDNFDDYMKAIGSLNLYIVTRVLSM